MQKLLVAAILLAVAAALAVTLATRAETDMEQVKPAPPPAPAKTTTADQAIQTARKGLQAALKDAKEPGDKARIEKAVELLDKTPAVITVGTPAEVRFDKGPYREGAFEFQIAEFKVNAPAAGKQGTWTFQVQMANRSEKENIASSAWSGKFEKVALSDDTGRDYILTVASRAPPIAVPGTRFAYQITVVGEPNGKASEYSLTLPAFADRPGVRFIFPTSAIFTKAAKDPAH